MSRSKSSTEIEIKCECENIIGKSTSWFTSKLQLAMNCQLEYIYSHLLHCVRLAHCQASSSLFNCLIGFKQWSTEESFTRVHRIRISFNSRDYFLSRQIELDSGKTKEQEDGEYRRKLIFFQLHVTCYSSAVMKSYKFHKVFRICIHIFTWQWLLAESLSTLHLISLCELSLRTGPNFHVPTEPFQWKENTNRWFV